MVGNMQAQARGITLCRQMLSDKIVHLSTVPRPGSQEGEHKDTMPVFKKTTEFKSSDKNFTIYIKRHLVAMQGVASISQVPCQVSFLRITASYSKF